MTHDELTQALLDAAPAARLPEAARRHLETCRDCAALARALEILAAAPEAAAGPPPAGYWDDFDLRLRSRLGSRAHAGPGRALRPGRSTATSVALGRLAAALVLVAAGWAAVRGLRAPAPAPSRGDALALAAASAPALLVEEAETLTGAWSHGWLSAWTEDATSDPTWSQALPSEPGGWSDLLADPLAPVDAVDDELTGWLSDEQAAELARRLRQEISS